MLLHDAPELCVCDLTRILGVPQPLMSRHLGTLREAGLLLVRREGLWMHYRINPDLPTWTQAVIEETEKGMTDLPPCREDRSARACSDQGA